MGQSSWKITPGFHWKGPYSLITQLVGGFDIHDTLSQAPGSYHDAANWGHSDVFAWFYAEFPYKFKLGESLFPIRVSDDTIF